MHNIQLKFAEDFVVLPEVDGTNIKFKARWPQKDLLGPVETSKNIVLAQRIIRTSTAMYIRLLHHCMTHNGANVLVITEHAFPMKRSYETILSIIKESPELLYSLKSCRNNPPELMFDNYSSIRFHHNSTTKKKSEHGLCGESPTYMLFLDCNYYKNEDFLAYIPLIESTGYNITTPQVWMLGVSDSACSSYWGEISKPFFSASRYKVWWFSSKRNPIWTTKMDNETRSMLSTDNYLREMLGISTNTYEKLIKEFGELTI